MAEGRDIITSRFPLWIELSERGFTVDTDLAARPNREVFGLLITSLIVRVSFGELLLLLEDSEQRGKEPQFSDENWGSSHLAPSWQDGALRDHSQQLLRPLCSHRTQHVADLWPMCGYYNLSSSQNLRSRGLADLTRPARGSGTHSSILRSLVTQHPPLGSRPSPDLSVTPMREEMLSGYRLTCYTL